MRILVNARFLIKERLEGIGLYSYEILHRMVLNQPDDLFIFCFDRPYDPSFIFAENVIPDVIRPPARHPLLFIWWFDVGIPRAYKRHQADLFFSPDGFLSLSERVKKQVLVIHDLAYLHYPEQIDPVVRWYYRRYMPKFIRRADRIITVSRTSADDIATNFPFAKAKTTVILNGCRELFVPLGASQNAETKASYSSGKDYFLVIGAIHPRKNLTRILMAYQHFRNHCSQDTKLLIVGRKAWKTKSLEEAYAAHPNKEDIGFLGFVTNEALAQLLSAAKGLIFASLFEGFGLPIIEAMQAGVPVITSDRSAMKEISGKAALLVDPESVLEIGEAMCSLCENPLLVESLIKQGMQRAMQFSWALAAAQVWQEINGLCAPGQS